MRLATYNLESLDLPPKASVSIEARAAAIQPMLQRLAADVLCLQEVNGQKIPRTGERGLLALDRLLAGTPYEHFHRSHTSGPDGRRVADVHNLVTLSRYPIVETQELLHERVSPLSYVPITRRPQSNEPLVVGFERPILRTVLALTGGRRLTVFNVHLRAPIASYIAGQKLGPFAWKDAGAWAEGYHLSAIKRSGQALDLRLAIDAAFDADPAALVAIAGDFNAEDRETPLRIVIGAEEDTGNGDLASRSLALLDRAVPADRRFSVVHHGRPQMLDHILISRSLLSHFHRIEVHNELLPDELVGLGQIRNEPGSYHAPVMAEFSLPPS